MLLFPEDLQEATARCVHFVEAGEEASALKALAKGPIRVGEIDGSQAVDDARLHESLGKALAFPPYYGRNFDALVDCLGDEGVSAKGFLLVVRNATRLWRNTPVLAGALVEAWLAGAARRASDPIHLVFVWDDRTLSQLPPSF
jgi:RNAse (barnase) inhibitor barstar